jgi:hypothetical protein
MITSTLSDLNRTQGTFDAEPWKAVGKFTSEMEVLIGTSSVNSGCVIEMFQCQRELVYVYIYMQAEHRK